MRTEKGADGSAEIVVAGAALFEDQEEQKVAEIEEAHGDPENAKESTVTHGDNTKTSVSLGPSLERSVDVPKEGLGFATFCLKKSSLASKLWGNGDLDVPFLLFNPFPWFAAEPGNEPERWETSYSLLLTRV